MESNKFLDGCASVLTALLIASYTIFTVIPGGRYVSLVLSISVLFLKTRGKIELSFEPYYFFALSMAAFCFVSSFWAIVPSLSIEKARDMGATFIYFLFIFLAYKDDKDTWSLMRCFKWSGYIVTFYLIRMLGVRALLNMLMDSERMNADLGNVNTLGLAIAYGCVFEFLEIGRFKRFSISTPFLIPAVIVIAATQSRKALLILAMAFVLIFCSYGLSINRIFRSLLRLVVISVIAYALIVFLRSAPLFSGIYHRMMLLINSLTGEGDVGYSIIERKQMIQIGWEQFLRTPILGIGIGNAGEIMLIYNDVFYEYLHNNYIELLCCGGIVGFVVYYSRYLYLAYRMIRYRQDFRDDFIPCLILSLIFLVMDYGFVSYYDKSSQMFFALLFLQVRSKRKENKPLAPQMTNNKHKYEYLTG